MSGIRGIAKNLSALVSSHLIAVLQQVALVPLFLLRYGKAGYGEWLAISAAVSYLGTLDFGVQTYVNQDLTVRYHRGDMREFHVNQSTALRLLLGVTGVAAALSVLVFLLPVQRWLRMDGTHGNPWIAPHTVQLAVVFLALQALLTILFGYFAGTFMVVGRAHAGAYWNNAKNVSLILAGLAAVWVHSSFAVVALAQLAAVLLCQVGVLLHLRRSAPDIFPTLRYWDRALVPQILGPSGYFALIFTSNFLVYQLPILILQRSAGGVVVTLFSVMRTIFSMARNVLNALTQAIGPEVTTLFAREDWPALYRLYDYSERLVFAVIPVVSVGTLYLCPFLLTIWLKQPQLFVPHVYLAAAAISIVMSTKEHKFQFQFSTNTHRALARFMFGTYIGLGLLWTLAIPRFGLAGLLWSWFAIEVVQLLYLISLNRRFFAGHTQLERRYLVRLGGIAIASLAGSYLWLPRTAALPLSLQVAVAVSMGVLLLLLAVPLFGLVPIVQQLRLRLQRTA